MKVRGKKESNIISIVSEQAKALQRIAFSPVVREAGDAIAESTCDHFRALSAAEREDLGAVEACYLLALASMFPRERLEARLLEGGKVDALSVAYLALLATLLAYTLWTRLLQRHPAGRVTPFSLLVPVVGLAAAGCGSNTGGVGAGLDPQEALLREVGDLLRTGERPPASIMGSEVWTPWPISAWGTMTVTVLSGAMRTQAVSIASPLPAIRRARSSVTMPPPPEPPCTCTPLAYLPRLLWAASWATT